MIGKLLVFTLDVLGKVLLGITVLLAHRRIVEEHGIDRKVLTEMKREQFLGLLGIVLIIVGFFLQLPFKIVVVRHLTKSPTPIII